MQYLDSYPDDLAPIVCIDAETHPIQDGMIAPRSVCWAFTEVLADGSLGRSGLLSRDRARPLLERVLRGHVWLNHNVAFDAAVAAADFPDLLPLIFAAYDANRIRCSLVRQLLIDCARDELDARWTRGKWVKGGKKAGLHSLAVVAYHHLGEVVEKDDTPRLRYGELDGLPVESYPPDAVAYPIRDTNVTARVALAQTAQMRAEGFTRGGQMPDEQRQTRSAFAFQLLASWGLRTDARAVAALRAAVAGDLERASEVLRASGIERADGTRDMERLKHAVEAACYYKGIEPERTPTGEISTNANFLRELRGVNTALDTYAEASHARTIMSREIPALERGTVIPICARYEVLKATGRTSTSKPNVQNPSRKGGVRECYVPRPGWLFSDVDYEAIELRALAQVCLDLLGRSALAEAFRSGKDPHLLFAAQLLNISYEEAVRRRREPAVKEMRQLAKVANFGYPGGLGEESFVEYAHGYDERLKSVVDLAMSARLRAGWFRTWPEMIAYFARIKEMIGGDEGPIQQLRSGRIRGRCRFTQGANTLFQGLTADGAKEAGWDLARECYLGLWTSPPVGEVEERLHRAGAPSPLFGSRVVLFVHDQYVAEVPAADPRAASRAAQRHAHVMVAGMQRWLPDVPVTAAPALTRRWWKGAEGVWQGDLLVPAKPAKIDGEERWVYDDGMQEAA